MAIAEKDGVIDQNEIGVLRKIISQIKLNEVDTAMKEQLARISEKIGK